MDWLRKFLQGVRAAPSDEELGRRSSVYPDGQSRKSGEMDPYSEPNVVLETSAKLMEFRMLVGITTHPSFKAPRGYNSKQRPVVTAKGRPAPNLGLYPSVVANEFKMKKNFKNFSRLINFCLGLQIIVAAALTAVGAADGSHTIVTILGAINTVIAGFLTYLKGSGLPNRLKYFAHEWAKVREYIEHRERDLGLYHHDVDINREVNIIRAMYEEVKADIEQNTPDRFVGSSSIGSRTSTLAPASTLAKAEELGNDMSGKLSSILSGLHHARNKVQDMAKDIDGSVASDEVNRTRHRLAGDVFDLKGKLQQRLKEVEELEKGIESEVNTQAKNAIVVGEKSVDEFVEKERGTLEKDIEAARIDAQDYVNDAFNDARR